MSEPVDAKALRKAVRKQTAPLRNALDALDALCAEGPTLEVLEKGLGPLGDGRFDDEALEAQRHALHQELSELHQRLRSRARSQLVGALSRRGREEGVEVEPLSETPLELRIAPLTVLADFARAEATLLYAREPVQSCTLDPEAIWAARLEVVERIRAGAQGSPEFFECLLAACRLAQARRGLGADARVDLVDLLGPLSLLQHPVDEWRKLPAKALEPYPRWLLAYQLQRLRKDACLSHAGHRLELGAATGGSARKKQNVLFVPAAGDGQYMLSLRFTPCTQTRGEGED